MFKDERLSSLHSPLLRHPHQAMSLCLGDGRLPYSRLVGCASTRGHHQARGPQGSARSVSGVMTVSFVQPARLHVLDEITHGQG